MKTAWHALSMTALFLAVPLTRATPAPAQVATSAATSMFAEFPPNDATLYYSFQQGLNAKEAERRQRADPLGAETMRSLAMAGREDDALKVATRIFERYPERITQTLEALAEIRVSPPIGEVPGREERVQAVLDLAKQRMESLEKEARAKAAYALLKAESSLLRGVRRPPDWYRTRLEAIARDYAGTQAALEVELDLIENRARRDILKEIDEYEAFAKAHPATVAGAKAVYLSAFQLANNVPTTGIERRGADPTERVLRVMEKAAYLESGAFPPCEWRAKAQGLVLQTYVSSQPPPTYAPGNVDKLLAAYTAFAIAHWKLDEIYPDGNGIGYLLTSKVFELYKAKGEGAAGLDRLLGELEAKVDDRFGVRFLRAQFYARKMVYEEPAAKAAWFDKAQRTLESIADEAQGLYRRKALATLAALVFQQGDFSAARELFEKYARLYPASPYAWIASTRVGQCYQAAGNWAAAVSAYETVKATGDIAPVAQVLGAVLAGRAYEALGDPVKALGLFRRALGAWDPAFGESYSAGGPPTNRPPGLGAWDSDADYRVVRLPLEARIAVLERTTAAPGAPQLEQARAMLRTARWQDAARLAGQVTAQHPTSPNAAEARFLGHRAQLEEALEKADVEKPGADPKAIVSALDRLTKEPFDFAVCVAAVARAYLTSGGGAAPDGEKALLDALGRWRDSQRPPAQLTPIEKDVESIRSLLFRPNGDSLYAGTRWNGFAWPSQARPFVVTAPEVRVKTADGHVRLLSFIQRMPGLDNVLFADEQQLALLNTFMSRIGGTKARQGEIFFDKGYMEAPNQPLGPSLTVMAFLNKGFHVMPGHWGGWHFITFPAITELQFLDEPRTKAVARLRIGYGGADARLEKQDGRWTFTKVTMTWVE